MKLPVVSSEEVEKALKKTKFSYAPKRGKGSHRAFFKEEAGKKRLVIIPQRRDIPKGTLLSILKQAGLSKEEFIALLRK